MGEDVSMDVGERAELVTEITISVVRLVMGRSMLKVVLTSIISPTAVDVGCTAGIVVGWLWATPSAIVSVSRNKNSHISCLFISMTFELSTPAG